MFIMDLTKEHARKVYQAMVRSRLLEMKFSSLYKAGKIVGGVYLGKGQEAVSASVGARLKPGKDIFAPLIRDQAGRTAFGENMLDATRTYLGSAQGPRKARDGNCLLYTSPSPRDATLSRMPSSA